MRLARLVGLRCSAWAAAERRAPPTTRPASPLQRLTGPRADFALRCRGCHGFAGEGTPGHVPRLDGFVGLFTQVPDGRDYLMRVPGVARSAARRRAAGRGAQLDARDLRRRPAWRRTSRPTPRPRSAPRAAQVLRDRKTVRAGLLRAMRARGLIGPARGRARAARPSGGADRLRPSTSIDAHHPGVAVLGDVAVEHAPAREVAERDQDLHLLARAGG